MKIFREVLLVLIREETGKLELAWYEDFERQNDIPVVVKGRINVSSDHPGGGSPVDNFCALLIDMSVSGYPVAAKHCHKWINKAPSGWHDFEYDFTSTLEK